MKGMLENKFLWFLSISKSEYMSKGAGATKEERGPVEECVLALVCPAPCLFPPHGTMTSRKAVLSNFAEVYCAALMPPLIILKPVKLGCQDVLSLPVSRASVLGSTRGRGRTRGPIVPFLGIALRPSSPEELARFCREGPHALRVRKPERPVTAV
ncbi:hypothetical protein CB1_000958025 [Camelus ferus]|nr:hypothetical protein CB1_000958025 [Camelus ferus]